VAIEAFVFGEGGDLEVKDALHLDIIYFVVTESLGRLVLGMIVE